MDFSLTDKQKKFLCKIDKVCKNLRKSEDDAYLEERVNKRIIPEFNKIGMLGCPIDKRYGGLGYDILSYILALERIGEEGSSMRTFFSAHTSIGQMVVQNWANKEQKKRYLPDTTSGKKIMAFALTEPSAGSDPSAIESNFEEKDDYFLLNGQKHWIGNGTFAKVITTYAKNKSTGKISAFIVDMGTKDIVTTEIKNKIGLLTVKNAKIKFNNCKIPKKNLLGKKDQGLSVAHSALIDGRLSVAAGSLGVIKDCLIESINYSIKRRQHGEVIAKKQLIQEHIAKITILLESSKWLTYRAAIARQKLQDYLIQVQLENDDSDDWLNILNKDNIIYFKLRNEADKLSSIAKFYASNSAFDSANRSVQIFGSYGYLKTSRVAKHFLDSRATTIYEGANEVLKLKIASMILNDNDKYRAF